MIIVSHAVHAQGHTIVTIKHLSCLGKDCRIGVNAETLVIIDAHEFWRAVLIEKLGVIKILKHFLTSFVFVKFNLYEITVCVNCFFFLNSEKNLLAREGVSC